MARTTFTGPVNSLNGFEFSSTNSKTVSVAAPAALSAAYTLTLPPNDGSNGQVLTTDGNGVTTWTTNGAGTVTSVAGAGSVNGLTLTGTVTSSGSLTLGGTLDLSSPPAIGGAAPNTGAFSSVAVTNSTNTTGTFEPVVVSSTLTGAGVTGGRAKFDTTINSAAGSYTNALKANVSYGASGKTSGLGSSFVAELTLSAGTVDGNYAPLEVELNVPASASTGTATSFVYLSTQGANVAEMDTAGFLFNLQGLTAGSGKLLQTGTTLASAAATLRVKVGGTTYYLPLYDGQITT